MLNLDVDVMDDLDELLAKTLDRYFSMVEKTGYVKYGEVNKIILLIFLLELIEKNSYLITEEDYRTISNILSCLYGSSCLIPYMEYRKITWPIDNYIISTPIRISVLRSDIRLSQDNKLRLVNN